MVLSDVAATALTAVGLVLSIGSAFLISLALHELGHAIVAKIVGLPVVACGIGARKPWFKIRIGETCYYVGRPLHRGVTLALYETIGPPRWRMIATIAGGPLTSLVIAAAAAALIVFGEGQRPFFVGLAVGSMWLFLWTAIPRRGRMGDLIVPNDAALILEYWRDNAHLLEQLEDALARCLAMRDLCQDLGAVVGQVHFTLYAAWLQLDLEGPESAGISLADPVLTSPMRGIAARKLEALVHGLLAISAANDDSDDAVRAAEVALNGDVDGLSVLESYATAQRLAARRGELRAN